MKTKSWIKTTLTLSFIALSFQASFAQDLTLRISETSLNSFLGAVTTSRFLSYGHIGSPGLGITYYSCKPQSVSFDIKPSNKFTMNAVVNLAANLNAWIVDPHFVLHDVSITVNGTVSLQPLGSGFQVTFTLSPPVTVNTPDLPDWVNSIISDAASGLIANLPPISTSSQNPFLPNIVSQYFTSATPTLSTDDNGINLGLYLKAGAPIISAYNDVNNSVSVGSIQDLEGSNWATYPSPAVFTSWSNGSTHYVQTPTAVLSSSNGANKYKNWFDATDLLHPRSETGLMQIGVTVGTNDASYLAKFDPAKHIQLSNSLEGVANGGTVTYYNSTVPSPYNDYDFTNFTRSANTSVPNGTLGRNWSFLNWSDGVTSQARTITVDGDKNLTANYKGIHISNDASAFTNNSQRKFIETPDGVMWQTYTSNIGGASHVFLEYSTNGGGTWQIMKRTSGESYLDWVGQGKCPSLDWWDTGAGYYVVTVVFQEPTSNGKYEIDYVTFMRQPSSGTYQWYYQGIIYQEPSNGDSYSVNANPAIAFGHGSDGSRPSFVVAFERKSSSTYSSGINLKWGYMSYPGLSVTGGYYNPLRVANTNASSCNPTICSDRTGYPSFFHLAYEQDASQYTSTIQYTALTLSGDFSQCSQLDSYQLSNSSSMMNFKPCITGVNGYSSGGTYTYGDWYASWLCQPNPSIASKCAYTNQDARFSNLWYYYASFVSSTSINVSNDNSRCYIAWNSIYSHANQLVNTANPNSVANLNTSGLDVQMSNGPTRNDMRVSSYYGSSSPYYWSTSQALGSVLPKVSPGAVASGRGCTINEGSANFFYTFGDLNVDGQNIGFVDLPDSVKFTDIDTINGFLLTQPFNLTKDSKVVFTEMSGFADSSGAVNTLGKRGSVGYKVELVDNGTRRVAGTLESIRLTESNLHSTGMTCYSLDTKKIRNGTYRVQITMNTNLDSAKFGLVESRALENMATGASTQTLALENMDIITEYELAQNYPNPFNPTTVIGYTIPRDGPVSLKIFDVLGREVRTLVHESQTVGKYSVKFDGAGLASGIYFYQLRSGDFVSIKKMLLVK